jgi:hypothetical protein
MEFFRQSTICFALKDFWIVWLSNLLTVSVSDEGYSNLLTVSVSDEGYYTNFPDLVHAIKKGGGLGSC